MKPVAPRTRAASFSDGPSGAGRLQVREAVRMFSLGIRQAEVETRSAQGAIVVKPQGNSMLHLSHW